MYTLISFALVDGLEPWIFNIEKTFLTAKQLEFINPYEFDFQVRPQDHK